MEKLAITDLDLAGKRVLVRVDFNVPLDGTTVSDDTRLRASIPTIQHILGAGGLPVLMSHLGRPEGLQVADLSLEPVGRVLQRLLGREVVFVPECIGPEAVAAVKNAETGTVILLENLRYGPLYDKLHVRNAVLVPQVYTNLARCELLLGKLRDEFLHLTACVADPAGIPFLGFAILEPLLADRWRPDVSTSGSESISRADSRTGIRQPCLLLCVQGA